MTDRLQRLALFAMLPLTLAACGPSATDGPPAPADESELAAPTDGGGPGTLPNGGTGAPSGTSSLAALPEPFRGRWDASPAACAGRPGEMRLDVGPDRLSFYESVARVEGVNPGADGSVRADLAFEGEGERWTETRTLRLLPDGRLSVETVDGSSDRVRCD